MDSLPAAPAGKSEGVYTACGTRLEGERARWHPLGELFSLPVSNALCMQLSQVRWHRTPAGKIQIETKEQLQKRGVKSPDHADALVLAFAPTAQEIRVKTVRGLYQR